MHQVRRRPIDPLPRADLGHQLRPWSHLSPLVLRWLPSFFLCVTEFPPNQLVELIALCSALGH